MRLDMTQNLNFVILRHCFVVVFAWIAFVAPPLQAQDSDAERLFTLKVLPVFKEKCFGCHGNDPDEIRGDYNMLTRSQLIAGGETGDAAIVHGKPDESPLYSAILWEDMEMPPKENDRLTKEQIKWVRDWIAAGAPWPDEATRKKIRDQEKSVKVNEDGMLVTTSGGLSDDWTYRRYQPQDIWAFQKLTKPELPESDSTNPVDRFLNKKIVDKRIKVAKQSDPAALIRRLSYDLTGLPPSPEQVASFKTAWSADSELAWQELIDRLLNSKHYGERQAQHWLDVVRYADTAGFSNDYERSNVWRYRDYVIRSFNEDKPFDQFIVEQIAGDELDAKDPELLIATGMLRMGPWGTAMVPVPEARQTYIDDLVHNVGQTFLAMPMRCCKCHDHKFDPIPTKDYYRMYAAFSATQAGEIEAAFLPEENRNGFDDKKKLVRELLDYAKAELAKVNGKQEAAAKKWYEEHNLPYKNENERKADPEDQKPPRHVGLTSADKGIKKVREQDVWIWERRLERFKPLVQSVYNGPTPKYLNSRKLRKPNKIDTKRKPESFILGGGALEAKLNRVYPGVLSAAGLAVGTVDGSPYRVTDEVNGRRLELARWIANENNPLTARVIVNRIWQSHFGKGLVKTANNFGAKGNKPTHPELLDWLAADLIEHGWKIKRIHRLIVTSKAYQRSSKPSDPKHQNTVDPNNELLASFPPRRLTAEELRDGILSVTGELNREMGGLPIMPEINLEVALQPRMIQFSIAPAHQPSRTPGERNRRTIYAYRVRGQADPFLEIMNQPNPNESCEIRDSAAVSPQAFTLLNSDIMNDRSIALALRVQREFPGNSQQWIRRAVELAYGRQPNEKEQKMLHSYLKEMQLYHQENKPQEVKYPTQVTRSLVEEFSGEPFEFIEKLNVYNDYVPDPKPWTVDTDSRALADVCLLLFNSNEFVYVY